MKKMFIPILFSLLLYSCTKEGHRKETFNVALRAIPEKIDPRSNQINIFNYINIHLFSPMFEYGHNGILKSKYFELKTTSPINQNFDRYRLCLKKDIRFSDGDRINPDVVMDNLQDIHSKKLGMIPIKKISRENNCVLVTLERPDLSYFDKLTTINTSIIKYDAIGNAVGYGPYKISLINDKLIKLVPFMSKGQIKNILFHKVKDFKLNNLLTFDDFNYAFHHFPDENLLKKPLSEKFQKIIRPLHRTMIIITDIKDSKKRKLFNYCLNKNKYVKEIGIHTIDVPGYLPKGQFGYDVKFDNQKWKGNCNQSQKRTIRFYNFHPQKSSQLKSFFKTHQNILNVEVEDISVKEATQKIFDKDEMLMMVMADSPQQVTEGFFEFFISNPSVVSEKLYKLEELVKLASKASSLEEKQNYFKKAHEELLDSGYILPLGQVEAIQFYHKNIKNIYFTDKSLGFPQINLMTFEEN